MSTRDEEKEEIPLPHGGEKGHVRESVDSEITGKDLENTQEHSLE